MRRSFLNRFTTDQRGAIGPLYAVGILAFVAISAVGFDAGRLWALDTELQNAADQAALAAATQLDGGDDAITRARCRQQYLRQCQQQLHQPDPLCQ